MYLYMGQMECGLRLLIDRLEGIRRAGETRSHDLEKNISKEELDRFETEIVGRALSIQQTASLTNEGLTDFIENFGSSL